MSNGQRGIRPIAPILIAFALTFKSEHTLGGSKLTSGKNSHPAKNDHGLPEGLNCLLADPSSLIKQQVDGSNQSFSRYLNLKKLSSIYLITFIASLRVESATPSIHDMWRCLC